MSQDNALQQAVLAALRYEPSVTAAHIGVTAEDGVITLTGHVSTYAQKHAAETVALGVRGVAAVAEELEVLLPYEGKRADDEIAAAARNRLAWDSSLPADAVKITVEGGWVTLTGEVDWRYQKDIAQEDIRRLHGIIGVSNHIDIKQKVNASDVSDEITHALHRSWFFDPNTIEVKVDGGKVRLTGAARSPHDRRVAAATAWNIAGVQDVENDIVIA
jgi:osmotically-inducible protein OsmY